MSNAASRTILATIVFDVLLIGGVIAFSVLEEASPSIPARIPFSVEQTLDAVLDDHRREMSKRRGCLSGRNDTLWRLYLKGRLLTRAYPGITEGLLLARATDPAVPPATRAFAIGMLGELCRTGRTHLESTLQAMAAGPEPFLAQTALRELSAADASGRFLDLYRSKCQADSWAAFDAVSYWHDRTTILEMERIVAASPGNQWPESSLRLSAQNVLARLKILASPDCDATLLRILDGSRDSYEFGWALKVARMKSMPGLLAALRVRLNRVQAPPAAFVSEAEAMDYARAVQDGFDPVRGLAEGREIGMDGEFDDALIAYAELGGVLDYAESRRLTLFGYLGDPVKRLEEMLNSKD